MDTWKEDGAALLGPCSGLPQGICKDEFHTAGLSLGFLASFGHPALGSAQNSPETMGCRVQTPLEVPALLGRQEQGSRRGRAVLTAEVCLWKQLITSNTIST